MALVDLIFNDKTLQPDEFSEKLISQLGNKERLTTLYKNLIREKYLPLREQQKTNAATDLQKQVKRAVRDDPKFMKKIG